MDKRKRPLGHRALNTLIRDIDRMFEAYDNGEEFAKVRLDWCNWNVLSRLAHEVQQNRYAQRSQSGSSIRAMRIKQDAYDDDEHFDC